MTTRPSFFPGESSHKYVECWDCHQDAGALATARRPVRVLRMGVARIVGSKLALTPIDKKRCLTCHSARIAGTLSARGILVRHSDFIKSETCQSCHTVHNKPAFLILDKCAACHNEEAARNSCDTCHAGKPPDVKKAPGWLGQVHATGQKGHGTASFASCSLCHPKVYCQRCHKIVLPHGSDWKSAHGKGAEVDPTGCLKCHERKGCDGCHRIAMPHPGGWLAKHSEVAVTLGQKRCLNCHEERNCLNCHIRHTHPAGFPER